MKKAFLLIFVFVVFVSCKDAVMQKPDNLIPEDKMENILYDIALVEAVKVENPKSLTDKGINPETYVYQKYKIDSLQFSKSDKYYASDINNYEKMYGKVLKRLEKEKTETDLLIKKGVNVGERTSQKVENPNMKTGINNFPLEQFREQIHQNNKH